MAVHRVPTRSTECDVETLAARVRELGVTVGGAESLTAGQVSARLVAGAEASRWFRGALVCYSTEVKRGLLHVPDCPVVSEACVSAMAEGVRSLLGCDLSYATTGVGGPSPADGCPAGTVWIAVSGLGPTTARHFQFRGEPQDVVEQATAAAIDLLRGRLKAAAAATARSTSTERSMRLYYLSADAAPR